MRNIEKKNLTAYIDDKLNLRVGQVPYGNGHFLLFIISFEELADDFTLMSIKVAP